MPVKPISSIRPTASQMPVSPVGSPKSVSPTLGISQTLRGPAALSKLPSIGVSDKPEPKQAPRLSTKLTEAWNSISKYMMTYSVKPSTSKFSAEYLGGFSGYADMWNGMLNDFGPGNKKVYQTAQGPQDLYEYQYRNLMAYGNIEGPARVSSFEFRDGRWWNLSTLRPNLTLIGNVDIYAGLPSSLKTMYPTNFLPTDEELLSVYHLALKNNLSSAAYKSLVNTVTASKVSSRTFPELDALGSALSGGSYSGNTVRTSAGVSEVFGKYAPQDADFSAAIANLSGLGGAALGLGGQSGSSLFGSVLGELGGVDPTGTLSTALSGISFIKSLYDVSTKGAKSTLGYQLFSGIFGAASALKSTLVTAVTNYFSNYKTHRFTLLSPEGKPITQWSETNPDDRQALMALAQQTGWRSSSPGAPLGKYSVNEFGISPNKLAGMLGLYFKFRASIQLADLLKSHDAFFGSSGYFSNVEVPEFYGR